MNLGTLDTLPTQLWLGHRSPCPTSIAPVRNDRSSRHKPSGGMWTSTWDASRRSSAWLDWARANDFNAAWYGESAWLLMPEANPPLIVIDSYKDLCEVFATWGLDDRSYRDVSSSIRYLDFERMATEGFAGMHLTARGNEECHTPPHRTRYGEDLNAWDVESTCWFRWSFIDKLRVEVAASSDDGGRDE